MGVNLLQNRRRMIMAAQPHLETVSGGVANFVADMSLPLKECKVSFLPKQSGSGDPSPENVRQISGWDGVSVYRAGKNLFDVYLENKNIKVDGSEGGSSTRLATPFEPIRAGTYTVSFDSDFSCALYVYSSDQAETLITEESNMVWNTSPMTFDITNGKYYRIKFKHNTDKTIVPSDLTDVQVEVGSTATPYEPYTATSYPITWQSAGTVYGGYVDLVRGVLVANMQYGDMGDFNWAQSSTADSTYCAGFEDAFIDEQSIPRLLVDSFKVVSLNVFNNSVGMSGHFATINRSGRFYCMTPDISGMTSKQVKSWMSGKKYCAFTNQPITYTLTPQQITALIGTNNIWSDAGNVELAYWSH